MFFYKKQGKKNKKKKAKNFTYNKNTTKSMN